MNKDNNKEKIINIGFKNEKIESCINPEEIFKIINNPDIKDNLSKCLNSGSKLFTH